MLRPVPVVASNRMPPRCTSSAVRIFVTARTLAPRRRAGARPGPASSLHFRLPDQNHFGCRCLLLHIRDGVKPVVSVGAPRTKAVLLPFDGEQILGTSGQPP